MEITNDTPSLKLLATSSRSNASELFREKSKAFFGDNIDSSKSSFQTYINELFSDLSTDLQVNNSFLFNEKFLNTAKTRSSILSRGSEFGYIEKVAEPEKIYSIIAMKVENTDTASNFSMTIKQENLQFKISIFNYILKGDLSISYNKTSNQFSIVLRNFYDNSTKLLPSQLITIENELYLLFQSELLQLDKTIKNEIISFREKLSYYPIEIDVTKELHKINMYYFDNQNNRVSLQQIESFSSITSDTNLDVFTVNSTDENKYEILLDNGSRFKFIPIGTELFIEVYETTGEVGRVKNPTFEVFNLQNNRKFIAYSEFESQGGRNTLTNLQLKTDIIRTIQTPDKKTVVTEYDFRNVFSEILDTEQDNYLLLLRRNDPIERVSDVFLKLYNERNYMVYTNTLNLDILKTSLSSFNNGNIPRNTRLKELVDTTGEFNRPYLVPANNVELLPNTNYYKTFLPIKVNESPVYSFNVFNTSLVETLTATPAYESYDYTSFTLFYSLLDIKYDVSTKKYLFSINIFSNSQEVIDDDLIMDSLKVKLVLNDNKQNSSKNYKYFVFFNRDPEEKTRFVAHIETDEIFNNLQQMGLKNVYVKNESTGVYELNTTSNNFINSEIQIDTFIYLDNIVNKLNDDSNILQVNAFNNSFNKTSNNTTLFSNQEFNRIDLFSDMTEVMYSSIKEHSTKIEINNVAVVEENDIIENKETINLFLNKLNILKRRITDINEVPSKVSVKFFNTNGKTFDYLNNEETRLHLNLEVSYNPRIASQSIIQDIKELIVERINKIETSLEEDRNIYISDIISQVKDEIPGLIQVRVLNYNDNIYYVGVSDIKKLPPVQLKSYTPPILNIRQSDITISTR